MCSGHDSRLSGIEFEQLSCVEWEFVRRRLVESPEGLVQAQSSDDRSEVPQRMESPAVADELREPERVARAISDRHFDIANGER